MTVYTFVFPIELLFAPLEGAPVIVLLRTSYLIRTI